MSFKIYHDSNHFDIIDDINKELSKFGLKLKFEDGEFDGYDIVHLKGSTFTLEDMRKAFDRGEWEGAGKSQVVRDNVFNSFIEDLVNSK